MRESDPMPSQTCLMSGAHAFRDVGNRVDEGDLQRQKRVGGVLDELGALGVGHDDLRFRHFFLRRRNNVRLLVVSARSKRRVNFLQQLGGEFVVRADYDAIGIQEVGHRRAFAQEFRVGSHREQPRTRAVEKQRLAQRLAGPHRNGALLHDYLALLNRLCDFVGHRLDERQVRFSGFRLRRPHRNENCIRHRHRVAYGSRKIQPPALVAPQQLRQVAFMDGYFTAHEHFDFGCVIVHGNHRVSNFREARCRNQSHVT